MDNIIVLLVTMTGALVGTAASAYYFVAHRYRSCQAMDGAITVIFGGIFFFLLTIFHSNIAS